MPPTQTATVTLYDARPELRPAQPGDPCVVRGELILTNSPITHLPPELFVHGSLYLQKSLITCLPESLSVRDNLDMRRTHITHLPDVLSVGGYLDLEHTHIIYLPENLSVGGHLDLEHTPLTYLPKGLSVGDHLFLNGSCITQFPEDMLVSGRIYPPDTLIDLIRFRATLTAPWTVFGSNASAHVTAATYKRLVPYPDVLRVFQSIAVDGEWTIAPL